MHLPDSSAFVALETTLDSCSLEIHPKFLRSASYLSSSACGLHGCSLRSVSMARPSAVASMTGGEEGLQGPRLLPAAGMFPFPKALKAQ